MTEKLCEISVQHAVWERYKDAAWLMPNFTPAAWWEADVWAWYPSGRTMEFEIKLTKQDFLADLRKEDRAGTLKHARLQLGATTGPNRFTYVIPASLEEALLPLLPEHAGLMTVSRRLHCHLKEVKKAPLLHSEKSERPILATNVSLYHRYWQLKGKVGAQKAGLPPEGLQLEDLIRISRHITALSQLTILQALQKQDGPVRHTEVGELCRLASGTVKSAAAKLETAGLLLREPMERRNECTYEISAEGRQLLRASEKH